LPVSANGEEGSTVTACSAGNTALPLLRIIRGSSSPVSRTMRPGATEAGYSDSITNLAVCRVVGGGACPRRRWMTAIGA